MRHLATIILVLSVLFAQWCVCGTDCVLTADAAGSPSSACCSGCPKDSQPVQKDNACDCLMCSADVSSELVETAESFHIQNVPHIAVAKPAALTTSEAPIRTEERKLLPPGPPAFIAFGVQLT